MQQQLQQPELTATDTCSRSPSRRCLVDSLTSSLLLSRMFSDGKDEVGSELEHDLHCLKNRTPITLSNKAIVDIRLRSRCAIAPPTSRSIIDSSRSNACNQASAPVVHVPLHGVMDQSAIYIVCQKIPADTFKRYNFHNFYSIKKVIYHRETNLLANSKTISQFDNVQTHNEKTASKYVVIALAYNTSCSRL